MDVKAEKTLQLMLPNENIRDTLSCKTQSGRFTASEFLEITVFALYEVQLQDFILEGKSVASSRVIC